VRVIWLGTQFVEMPYALATGSVEDCTYGIHTGLTDAGYLDETCSGQAYRIAGDGIQDPFRFTRHVEYWQSPGAVYYETAQPALPPQPYYYWNNDGTDCLYDAVNDSIYLRAWNPVPDWALEALPEPPYSLIWE
jgi:hypothetical protein